MANWWLTWKLVNLSIKEFIGRICCVAYKIKLKRTGCWDQMGVPGTKA